MTQDEFMQALEEVEKAKRMPLRRYTPDNPPPKEWLSNLPIAVPIKPEFIRPKFDLICPFEIDKTYLEKMIEECHTPLQIITTEEKTVMQAKAVFDLYFKRARAALEKAFEEKFFKIVEEDENIRLIKATFENLNKELKDLGDQPGFSLFPSRDNFRLHCTNSTKAKVDELSKRESEERERLHKLQEEIEALLLSCETYEQAKAILCAYGVIEKFSDTMLEYKPSF